MHPLSEGSLLVMLSLVLCLAMFLNIAYNDVAPGVAFDTTSKLFLVAEYDRCVEISTSNGMVTAVRSLNV